MSEPPPRTPPAEPGDHVTKVLSALADPTRRAVLTVIAREGAMTASRLGGVLPVSRQAIAKHLALLEDSGLVTRRKEGRDVLFMVRREPLVDAADWLQRLATSWGDRLTTLKSAAERAD